MNKYCAIAERGDLQTLKKLEKESLFVVDDFGFGLLHYAAAQGRLNTVRWLCRQGVNINQTSHAGTTPLMQAVLYAQTACAKWMIENGADIHIKDIDNASVLVSAAYNGSLSIIKLLVERGIDINARTTRAQTALKIVVDNMRHDIAAYLVERGADISPLKNIDPDSYARYAALYESLRLKKRHLGQQQDLSPIGL